MPQKRESESGAEPKFNRRESDRTGQQRGVQAGGRRKTDRAAALPRSNFARYAIVCSFLFSTGLIAWAFTLPFRSGAGRGDGRGLGATQATLTDLEYEARLTADQYVDYTRDLDRRLLSRVRDKNRPTRSGLTKRELHQKWSEGVEKRKQQFHQMLKDSGEESIKEGTIEWQTLQDLQKVISDAPAEA
ncbi:hypothetical protein Mal15_08450 [Stieleria maiorica]|uniref:Transmembrane protein n=1 Tax=Stieleria maiorica TaxID=2795974 RepID=A0A5B9MBA9_9BACT|nr:hypothetical protein [Stieleria maiorica]QEF96815.1 hypothetical protein Mal15_08450 [Stieleria maiorica]